MEVARVYGRFGRLEVKKPWNRNHWCGGFQGSNTPLPIRRHKQSANPSSQHHARPLASSTLITLETKARPCNPERPITSRLVEQFGIAGSCSSTIMGRCGFPASGNLQVILSKSSLIPAALHFVLVELAQPTFELVAFKNA